MPVGLLWRRRVNHNYPERNVIILPASLKEEIIEAGLLFSGHMGISKKKERKSQSYLWPNIDRHKQAHLNMHKICQERRVQHMERSEKLTPLQLCAKPNQQVQQVQLDLFGPLRTAKGKKW
jgi:hypothetical protein